MSDPNNASDGADQNQSHDEYLLDELMNSELGDVELSDAELSSLGDLLGDPQLWDETDLGVEDFLVDAIGQEAAAPASHVTAAPVDADPGSNVVSIFSRSKFVRATVPFVAGIAAALLLVVGFSSVRSDDDDFQGINLALAGTDLAPDAQAAALIDEGPLGVRIKLDVSGLEPSPEGTYYEAWVRKSPEVGVSAGTFHLRGGDGVIVLWAGVSTDDYPLITVTLQQEGDGAASSGKVVLKGRLADN